MSDNFWWSLILYTTAGLVWLGGEAGRAYVGCFLALCAPLGLSRIMADDV